MKALVTGGAGFIGSHLTERLMDDGHQVVVVDDLSTGSVDNLDALLGRYGFLMRVVDMLDTDALADCFAGVDWVFHLAGDTDDHGSRSQPQRGTDRQLRATLQVLECARHFGVRSFVYASSSACYDPAASTPTPEQARLAPATPGGLAKQLAEEMVRGWTRMYDLPSVCLRLFNVYGSRAPLRARAGSVVPIFLAQRAGGQPLTIAGDGAQTRDFVHVEDVTRAMLLAAEAELRGEVLNIASGRQTSVARIAEIVSGDVVHAAPRPGELRAQQADIRAARRILGWRPELCIEDGLNGLLSRLDLWTEAPIWTRELVDRLHGAVAPEPDGVQAEDHPVDWQPTPPAEQGSGCQPDYAPLRGAARA